MYSKITPGKLFKVNIKTGVITLTGKLDYETQRQYVLVIKAEDLQDKNKVDYTTVIIHVKDVNDNAPVFVDYPKTITVDVVMYTVFNLLTGNVPYFIIVLSLTPDNFTRQGRVLSLNRQRLFFEVTS